MTTRRKMALPCFACGTELENISGPNQPSRGLEFTTPGHYGTTVFDPMDGSALAINVCDGCLTKAVSDKRTMTYQASQYTYERMK